tara:strand:- start:5685 stop:6233 length:549 start_codon:yes stop_codon:yes gene_type:complete
MVKKQEELFNIPENEVAEAPVAKEKPTRKKKPMSDEEKSVLIDRLKAGRERKKAEREGKGVKVIEPPSEAPTPSPVERPTPRPLTPHPSEREILKQQLDDLKKEIKETKEKQELKEMKEEMKQLKLLLQNSNKTKSNENVVVPEAVKQPPLKAVTQVQPQASVPTQVAPIKIIETRLKKRFK